MDLFNLDLPNWARRTLQVVYIAVAVVTVLIPIGKLVLGAKAAFQGLKATARKVLAAIAAKLPSRAGIRAALQRVKGSISSGLSRLGGSIKQRLVRSFQRRGLPGQRTGLGRKMIRFFLEDRLTFGASKNFFKRWRSVFGTNHGWSMEHMIIKDGVWST
jgi:hypothetical protein